MKPVLSPKMAKMLESFVAKGFVFVLCVAPLPLGSNRDWSWSPLAVAVGVLLLLHTLAGDASADPAAPVSWDLKAAAALVTLVLAWTILQCYPPFGLFAGNPIVTSTQDQLGGGNPRIAVDIEHAATGAMRILLYCGVFLLATRIARNRRRARRIVLAVLIGGLAYTAYALAAQAVGGVSGGAFQLPVAGEGFSGPFINRNNYATYAGLCALAALGLVQLEFADIGGRPMKLAERVRLWLLASSGRGGVYFASLVLLAGGIVLSSSRAALVSFALALLTMVILGSNSRRGIVLATILAVAAITLLAILPGGQAMIERLALLSNEGSTSEIGRRQLLILTANAVDTRFWTGWGLDSFSSIFSIFQPPELQAVYDKAHNTYLETASDLGVLAAAALVLAIALPAVRCAIGIRNRLRHKAIPLIGVCATILIAVHSLADFGLQIPAVAVTYFALLGAAWGQSWSSRGA